jgi:hypothetical protein
VSSPPSDLAGLREQLLRRSLAPQQLLGPRNMDRRQPDRTERDARVGDLATVDPDGGRRRDDRPVAGPALDLLVRATGAGTQLEANLGQELAVADRSHVGADVEVLHPDDALAIRAADHDLGLRRRADRREVLGRVGLAERTADRPAVANDGVGDHLLRLAKQRKVLGQQLGVEEIDVPGERPDPDLAVLLADVGELVEVVDVDQVLGLCEPQLHHRQQAVPAGDDPRPGAALLERCDGAVDARRALVLE